MVFDELIFDELDQSLKITLRKNIIHVASCCILYLRDKEEWKQICFKSIWRKKTGHDQCINDTFIFFDKLFAADVDDDDGGAKTITVKTICEFLT